MALIRVFIMPKFTGEFCFGGGKPMSFIEVDWFNEYGEGDFSGLASSLTDEELITFVKTKSYYHDQEAYLILRHDQKSLTINYPQK